MVTKEQMNEVLRQLAAIYPAWKQAISTQDQADNLKRVWWDEFNRIGLDPKDLQRGVIQARATDSSFLPSLGQFIGWCESGGPNSLPGRHQAYQEACLHRDAGDWSSPAVYHAASRTGLYDLKTQSESKTRPLFFEHYADVCAEVQRGTVLELPAPEPVPEIAARPATQEDQELARKTLDELYKNLDM